MTKTMRRSRVKDAVVLVSVLGMMLAQVAVAFPATAGIDVQVNNSGADTGDRSTQSETSLAFGNGVLCAGFNDSAVAGSFSGFANSGDLGANWNDVGALPERGDPVLVHHTATDTFYYASLGNTSIRVAASTNGCQSFGAAVNASTFFATTTLADKPWIAVDNTGGATDGNLYICWTRFIDNDADGNADTSELRASRSTDGGTTWVNEQIIAAAGTQPFGCSIGVASDGAVSVVWADRSTNNILFLRSTDAGVTYASLATVNGATALRHPGIDNVINCAPSGTMRRTLNGNIRMLHQAWMAIDTTGGPNDGNIYVVFASDPVGAVDQSDVFFSVSTNNGANWSALTQLGAGGGATDQFEPHVAVADNGDVGVAWYDRRNDVANNLAIDVYSAFSSDGGATFGALVRVTDTSFGVPQLNPNFDPGIANCYMGEYLSILGEGGGFYYLWGDNRNTVTNTNWPAGRPDPDVFFDVLPGPSNSAPTVSVDPASGDEGENIVLSGSASDTDGDPLLFSWSATPGVGVDPGAVCVFSNETTLTPTVVCSDDGSYTLTLTATGDPAGPVMATATLTLSNVAPDVSATTPDTTIDEGEAFTMSASFTDPGWNDTYTGTIDWSFPGELPEPFAPVVTTSGPPADVGSISGMRQYGDNGVFTVTATVSDDDTGSGSDAVTLTVNNVAPTAEIDETGAILINGVPVFLANAGDPVDFSARSTDPGSDDLTLTWDWDDGPPSPDTTEVSLVNPPGADPFPSPSVQPRDVTSDQTHVFGDACLYDIVFASIDDDGGSTSDTAVVLIVGNAGEVRSAGLWYQQFRRNKDFTSAQLDCYLAIVNFVSTVFSEVTPASTAAEALEVLNTSGSSEMEDLFDRQLLAALLNFANGGIAWDQLIDTDGDSVGDTPFGDVISNAEAIRLNPATTREELEAQKDLLERINLGTA